MVSDKLIHSLSLFELQHAIRRFGGWNLFVAAAATAALALLVDYAYMLHLRSKMPPGPFPLPVIGNTHLLPDAKPWIYFEKLSKDYDTPLITFWIGR